MRWGLLGVLLMCLADVACAQDQQETYPPSSLQVFLGLDDTSPPSRVAPGRAQSAQNMSLSIGGDLRKRAGLDMIGEALTWPGDGICVITGLTYAQFAGGTARIVAVCGDTAYYLSGSDWTPIANTQWQSVITAGQNNQFVFTAALSNLIAVNDVDPPFQWAGGAADTWQTMSFSGLTNAITAARVATFYQNYLIFGNTVEGGTRYPTRIRWANVGTINAWTNADYVDVAAPAGQELNCVGQLYGDVILGFTSSLYRMSLVGGSGTFAFTKLSDEVGCIAKNSLQQVTLSNAQTVLLFLDRRKRLYAFNGTVPAEISQFVHTTLDGMVGTRLPYAVSTIDEERYYICLSTSGTTANTRCLAFNYLIGEWMPFNYAGLTGINAMARVLDAESVSRVYLGTADSFIYQFAGTGLDNDVGGASGIVDSVSRIDVAYASSLQVLYDDSASYTVSGLIGAPIELVGGAASGLVGVVVDNTATGLVVARDFSTTPTSTTAFEVGRVNAYYTTRWDDFGDPSWIKQGVELFLVADADIGSSLDIGYAVDFQSNTAAVAASLTPSAGSLWGTAVWGVDVWGGGDTVFIGGPSLKVPLNDDGRWWRFTFTEDDRDENLRLHGWQVLYDKVSRN